MQKVNGGFLITQIKRVSSRVLDRVLIESGIDAFNGAQGRILYVLWQEDNITITQISKATSLAKTTLTNMLDKMESQELITRNPDPTDRKKTLIRLTAKSRELQLAFDNISDQVSGHFYQGFEDEEIEVFEQYLQRVLHNLQVVEKESKTK